MLAAALTTAPALLLVQTATGSRVDTVAIALGGGVLCGLVLLRLTSVIHALDGLRVTERE